MNVFTDRPTEHNLNINSKLESIMVYRLRPLRKLFSLRIFMS